MLDPRNALGPSDGSHPIAPHLILPKLDAVLRWLERDAPAAQLAGTAREALEHARGLCARALEADPEPTGAFVDQVVVAWQEAIDPLREDSGLRQAYALCQEALEDFCALAREGDLGTAGAAKYRSPGAGKPPAKQRHRMGRAEL